MRSKAYILQNFCIIDSMKLHNERFPFLYNTFYQWGGWQNFARGVGGLVHPAPALATPLIVLQTDIAMETVKRNRSWLVITTTSDLLKPAAHESNLLR
jgi:hypothetical protein